jgi:AAA domain
MTNATSPQHYTDQELLSLSEPAVDWLWHGFVSRNNTTLLTSLPKAGKTTLLTLILARRKTGGLLAGLVVSAGKTIVVSEEPAAFWRERALQHDFGGNLCLLPQPFDHVPASEEWRGLVRRLAELRYQNGADLLVVDTVSHFLRSENHGAAILDALMPLDELKRAGTGVLLHHHPAKGARAPGLAARGHGVLLGHVDISIEMHHAASDPDNRARRLYARSRHAATPRHLLMELSADGTDYVRLHDAEDEGFHEHWDVLRMVLEDAPKELTRQQILDDWPADFLKPARPTLWRWLGRAVAGGLVLSDGTGRKTDPFRYWLPGAEERWRAENPLYDLERQQKKELELLFGKRGVPKGRSG